MKMPNLGGTAESFVPARERLFLYALTPFFRVFFLKDGGRSTAMSSQYMRQYGANILVNETA